MLVRDLTDGQEIDQVLLVRGREVRPVAPQVVITGETARIVLPGEPGYPG